MLDTDHKQCTQLIYCAKTLTISTNLKDFYVTLIKGIGCLDHSTSFHWIYGYASYSGKSVFKRDGR